MASHPFDVVGIGENSVDFVYRLSALPKPNTKLCATGHRVSCGGQVATALAACAAFGRRAAYVGAFGEDDNGKRIRAALAGAHVDTSQCRVRHAPNRHAAILVDEGSGDRTVIWHRDAALTLRIEELPRDVLEAARLVHVDDLDEEVSIAAARMARAAGIPVTSDIDRVTPRTPELIELSTAPIFSADVPSLLTGEQDPARALRMLRNSHAGWLCVTLGREGAMLLEGDRLHHVPAPAVDAIDTTGAGDVFRGAFIHALLESHSPREIVKFAVAAAAISCTREGAMSSVPTLAEVRRVSVFLPALRAGETS